MSYYLTRDQRSERWASTWFTSAVCTSVSRVWLTQGVMTYSIILMLLSIHAWKKQVNEW